MDIKEVVTSVAPFTLALPGPQNAPEKVKICAIELFILGEVDSYRANVVRKYLKQIRETGLKTTTQQ